MKYAISVIVDLPREQMLKRLDEPENMKLWQPALKSYELLSADPKAPGARMKMIFDQNGREFEMVETTLDRSLPDSMTFEYETRGVWNQVVNRFNQLESGKTEWIQENEFRFHGFFIFMGLMGAGMFRRETLKAMNAFKAFAENS